MGRFVDFVTGGNAKVTANIIADCHYLSGGSYLVVLQQIYMTILMNGNSIKNMEFNDWFDGNRIENYSTLACVHLNALAAPQGISVSDTRSQFYAKVAEYMSRRNLPSKLISGDNRKISIGLFGG